LSLLLPSVLSAIGLFAFAVLAYSFTELRSLPSEFRRWLVIVGAFTLAAGSEIGTLFAVVDIYRKGGPRTWDWIALFFSLCTTVASFVLAFAALLLRDLQWVTVALNYGAVVLGVLAALDSYGGFMEFGLYLNSYDARLDLWERREIAEAERAQRMSTLVQQPQQEHTQPISTVVPDDIDHRRHKLCSLYRAQPDRTQQSVADVLGVSTSTVRNDLSVLEDQGLIRRVDGQVVVL
jgi:DNA-binding transcriptional regulator YiaG